MADFINHNTKVSGVLWCVDEMHLIEDDKTVTITGWISHIMQPVKSFIINDRPHYPVFKSRPDVKEFYPLIPTDEVGFEITLSIKDLDKNVALVLQDSSMVEDIGTFEKWGLYHSGFNPILKKGIVVVDDFYEYPDWVREYAMNNLDFKPSGYHKGQRSSDRLILEGTKEKFEEILGKKIINWNYESYANGVFQYCVAQDPIVYHVDTQTYAAMVYLTTNAPLNSGTSTYRSKITGLSRIDDFEDEKYPQTFKGLSKNMNFYDKSTFELVDSIANVYNRLVMFDAKAIHAATEYFGDEIDNARFFHLFFFDVEW